MYVLLQQQQKQLLCLFFILITQTISIPIKENVSSIRCHILNQNCTFIRRNPFSSSISLQSLPVSTTSSTSRIRSITKPNSISDFDAFSENLKRAALILAGIALGLVVLRVCLMLCKSRSRNNSLSNRHSSTVRPQVATIEHHQFKPDLPPAYAEAIVNIENDGGKLPSYEELPYEQRHVVNNDGYVTTRL